MLKNIMLLVSIFLVSCGGGGSSDSANNSSREFRVSQDDIIAEYDNDYLDLNKISSSSLSGTWFSVTNIEQYGVDEDSGVIESNPAIELNVFNVVEGDSGLTLTMCRFDERQGTLQTFFLRETNERYYFDDYYDRYDLEVEMLSNNVLQISELASDSQIMSTDNSVVFMPSISERLYKLSDLPNAIIGSGIVSGDPVEINCFHGVVRRRNLYDAATGELNIYDGIVGELNGTSSASVYYAVGYIDSNASPGYAVIGGDVNILNAHDSLVDVQRYDNFSAINSIVNIESVIDLNNLFRIEASILSENRSASFIIDL